MILPRLGSFVSRHRTVARLTVAALAVGAMIAWSAPCAQAELTWTQKTVELQADAGSSILEARYHFVNQGSKAVDIGKVESSCGCTTVDLTERHYEPGAGGDIVARYTVGGHVGVQRKSILVETNDGHPATELNLVVKIPEILRIQPPFVSWSHGEATTAKTITLEMLQEATIKEITVRTSNAGMTAKLEPLEKGRKYQIVVAPSQTEQNLFATLTVLCKFGTDEKTFRAYATVKPPPIPTE